MKECRKCSKYKKLSEFNNNKNTKDGKQYYCRECFSNYNNTKGVKFTRADIKPYNSTASINVTKYELSFAEVIDGILCGRISEARSQEGRILRRYTKNNLVYVSGAENRLEHVSLCDAWNRHKFNITKVVSKRLKKIQDIIKEYPDVTVTSEGIKRDGWQFPIKQENFDLFGKIYDGNIDILEQDWIEVLEKEA